MVKLNRAYLRSLKTTKYLLIIPPPPLSRYFSISLSCYAEMFTTYTCILLPYILRIIYLSIGGPLDSGYVIILREGLPAVGGVIIVININ